MEANVEASRGLMLAEAVTFALAPTYMSRAEASKLVKEACQLALDQRRHLIDVVQETIPIPLNLEKFGDARAYLGSANLFIDRVLTESRQQGFL